MKIGFIDFSKDERNKILATLSLLGEPNAIDELGIGSIRDAYADILFPGISTLQTRAKYFVLIPYLFALASKQKLKNGREVLKWVQDKEDKLVAIIIENSPDGGSGIIGSTAIKRKRAVKNKPSSIYWNGIRTFGILENPKLSLQAAANSIYANSKNELKDNLLTNGESFDDITAGNDFNVVFSPLSPDYDIEKEISVNLTNKEAEYLASKISTTSGTKNSLLAYLVKNQIVADSFIDIPENELLPNIQKDYRLALGFSEFISGAHIRYNCIYSNYEDEAMMDKFELWKENFLGEDFDLEPILTRVPLNYEVCAFARKFLEHVKNNDLVSIDNLIIAREKAVKGSRSKLCKPTEYRYNSEKPIHNFKLDFRFGRAKVIIEDIIKGLEV